MVTMRIFGRRAVFMDDEIVLTPEMSEEFYNFEEFCAENTGHELTYFDLVVKKPLEIDSVTLAFSIRRLVRLSKGLLDLLIVSIQTENPPSVKDILATKGIQLDKTYASKLRDTIFAFRDAADDGVRDTLVKTFQLLAITRERKKINLNLGESYNPPEEGWTAEDFGGDDSMLDAVRSIEDPHWINTEEA
jgi:hypothetical protein